MDLIPITNDLVPGMSEIFRLNKDNAIYLAGFSGTLSNVFIFNEEDGWIQGGHVSDFGLGGTYSGLDVTFDNNVKFVKDSNSVFPTLKNGLYNPLFIMVDSGSGFACTGILSVGKGGMIKAILYGNSSPTITGSGNPLTVEAKDFVDLFSGGGGGGGAAEWKFEEIGIQHIGGSLNQITATGGTPIDGSAGAPINAQFGTGWGVAGDEYFFDVQSGFDVFMWCAWFRTMPGSSSGLLWPQAVRPEMRRDNSTNRWALGINQTNTSSEWIYGTVSNFRIQIGMMYKDNN
jgi:hypothetical protein